MHPVHGCCNPVASVPVGVIDLDGVNPYCWVGRRLVVSAEVLHRVLEGGHGDQVVIRIPVSHVVDTEDLRVVVRAKLAHEVAVSGASRNLGGPSEPPALAATVVDVAEEARVRVEQLDCGAVVVDPVGGEVVAGLPLGAGYREVHADRCDAGVGVVVDSGHAVRVRYLEPLVTARSASEHTHVVGNAQVVSVRESVSRIESLALGDGRVEAKGRAVRVVVDKSVAVGVHGSAPVGWGRIVLVSDSVAVGVIVRVVTHSVVVCVHPLG